MTNDEIRSLIDRLTDATKREARRISKQLEDGKITPDAWKAAMIALLTSAHIIGASVGRGGLQAMAAKDWIRVDKKVKWQSGFLPRFGRAIVAGIVVGAAMLRRAGLYGDSPYISYANADREANIEASDKSEKEMLCQLVQNSKEGCDECTADAAEGWIPVSEMGELGTRICSDYCLCYIEFEDET